MPTLHYALIEEHHRFKLLATYLDSHKNHKILVLFSTQPQIEFFESVFSNLLPKINLNFALVDSDVELDDYQQVLLLDIPTKFEVLGRIVEKSPLNSKIILFVFKSNRGYIKMVEKKLSLSFTELNFSQHKFLMIEDKYLELIDSNYAINRQAFYAYGSFLQYFNSHLLKRIFKTDQLNVKNVGLGFGMSIPPKVNLQAKFLTQKAQLKQKLIKRKQRLERGRQRAKKQKIEEQKKSKKAQSVTQPPAKLPKIPKTKKIHKQKA